MLIRPRVTDRQSLLKMIYIEQQNTDIHHDRYFFFNSLHVPTTVDGRCQKEKGGALMGRLECAIESD